MGSVEDRKRVYGFLQRIPRGKVATYKSIADALGMHPRAVAVALKMNEDPVKIHCYKVVHADGRLGGYSCEGGVVLKKKLLEGDGVQIVDGRVGKRFIV